MCVGVGGWFSVKLPLVNISINTTSPLQGHYVRVQIIKGEKHVKFEQKI